jgi:hypothetical protein
VIDQKFVGPAGGLVLVEVILHFRSGLDFGEAGWHAYGDVWTGMNLSVFAEKLLKLDQIPNMSRLSKYGTTNRE